MEQEKATKEKKEKILGNVLIDDYIINKKSKQKEEKEEKEREKKSSFFYASDTNEKDNVIKMKRGQGYVALPPECATEKLRVMVGTGHTQKIASSDLLQKVINDCYTYKPFEPNNTKINNKLFIHVHEKRYFLAIRLFHALEHKNFVLAFAIEFKPCTDWFEAVIQDVNEWFYWI